MNRLILMVGLPASGKTTLRTKLFPNAHIVCPDDAIGYTQDNPWTFRSSKVAWKKADAKLQEYLKKAEQDIVFDATLLTIKKRKKYISFAINAQFMPVALFCDTPIDICKARNAQREKYRQVPERVIDDMATALEKPKVHEGLRLIMASDSLSGIINTGSKRIATAHFDLDNWLAYVKGGY